MRDTHTRLVCFSIAMATQKQMKANRQNSQFSTGPKTPAGLQVSAQNARTHGLFSKALLVESEDQSELDGFAEAIRNHLIPKQELEYLLVERIIACAWRLRRILEIERLLFRPIDDGYKEYGYKHCSLVEVPRGEKILLLSRYETAIERSLYRSMHELHHLQKKW